MTEPAVGAVAAASTAAGGAMVAAGALMPMEPWMREALVIVGCGIFGSLWPLSKATGLTRTQGAMLVLRLVGTAIALTGAAAWWVHRQWELPQSVTLSPLAFFIALIGDGWRDPLALWRRIRAQIPGGKP